MDITKTFRSIWYTHFDKPERIRALYQAKEHLPVDDFWKLFGEAWTHSESLFLDEAHIGTILDSGNRERYNLMMEPKERKKLSRLINTKKEITVYRGCAEEYCEEGFSWTTKKDIGERFAHINAGRVDGTPLLLEGKLATKDIIALFDNRGESEVVTLPENVYSKKMTWLQPKPYTTSNQMFHLVQAYGTDSLFGDASKKLRYELMAKSANANDYIEKLEEQVGILEQFGFEEKAFEIAGWASFMRAIAAEPKTEEPTFMM